MGDVMDGLTENLRKLWEMIVQERSGRTVGSHIAQIFNEILFAFWPEEKIRQDENSIGLVLFRVCSELIDFANRGSSDLNHACELILAASCQPFFSQTLTFFDIERRTLTNQAVD